MTILQPIGTQGCGCDRRDTLKALLSVDDALALIHDRTTAITGTEMLATGLALGRILADPVTAPRTWRRLSTMPRWMAMRSRHRL